MAKKKQRKVCAVCGGTGQISFFQGVSRFLLSNEECEVCAGTGYQFNSDVAKLKGDSARKQRKRVSGKNKK